MGTPWRWVVGIVVLPFLRVLTTQMLWVARRKGTQPDGRGLASLAWRPGILDALFAMIASTQRAQLLRCRVATAAHVCVRFRVKHDNNLLDLLALYE